MPRRPLLDPEEFFAEFRKALAAWHAVGCGDGPLLTAVVTLLWHQFGVAMVGYFRHRLPPKKRHVDAALAEVLVITVLEQSAPDKWEHYEDLHGWIWAEASKAIGEWLRDHPQGTRKVTPGDALLRDEFWARLRAQLNAAELRVFKLVLEALTPEEIATRFECIVDDVADHLSRIRTKAEDILDEGVQGTES